MRPGQSLLHYRLVDKLGEGAMGEVWLAEDTQLPRRVAVKLLGAGVADNQDAIRRLVREAEATASIEHPAVATVYEAGEIDGQPYLVMQYFDGQTLEERLTAGRLGISEVVTMATTVADALAEVHAIGIVHRDLKPANIILTARGPKILDFGVAAVSASPRLTTPGAVVGTPVTMAPEQVNGAPPDNRSDLWALGVILYRCLTGELPFAGDSYAEVFRKVLQQEPQRPGVLREEIDPDLDYVVMKLLRKDPAHRYGRAEDLLADLSSCAAKLPDPDAPTQTLHAVPRVAAPPRLAVVPFEVMSPDADDSYLAIGLVEDLIVDLTRVDRLRVASRAEVASYAGRTVPPRTLARELGADYVVTGSVRRAGNRARISAQLVRASDGHMVWAERFDHTLDDLFAVQEEVSKRIVEALQVAVDPAESRMLGRAPAKNTEAYTLYLRARELLEKSREENFRAERMLEQALALDPEFALAHAALGECYAKRGLRWWASTDIAEKALACAERALQLEPGLPDAYYVELMVRRLVGSPEQVLEAIGKVLETNPDDGQAREWAAWSYMALGKPEQALPILEQLTDRPMALGFLANCYEMLDRWDEAQRTILFQRERLMDSLRRDPEDVHERSLLGIVLIRAGETAAGLAQMERALQLASPDDNRIRYNAACAFAVAGQTEQAMDQLRKGVKDLPSFVSDWPRRDPDLTTLHDLPEFIELFGRAED